MKRVLIFFLFLSFTLYSKEVVKEKSILEQLNEFGKNLTDLNVSEKLKYDNLVKKVAELNVDDNFDKRKFEGFKRLLPYRRNYLMFYGYDFIKHPPRASAGEKFGDRRQAEAKFQISMKFPLFQDFLSSGGDLYAAYTQQSMWQIFNGSTSRPFRETNYQPEIFLDFDFHDKNKFVKTLHVRNIIASIIHQSNGQDRPKSRSWNRANLEVILGYKNWTIGGNIWNRFNEKPYKADDKSTDDNPDLEDFIGRQNIYLRYDFKRENDKKYSFLLLHQNDFFKYDVGKGFTKVEFTFPSNFNKNFDFIIQYFNGYGESLIDYDIRVSKIYIGVLLTDWSFKIF